MKQSHIVLVTLAITRSIGLSTASPGATVACRQLEPFVDGNPFLGKTQYANRAYANKLEETISYFKAKGDALNAARAKSVQKISTFSWISETGDVSRCSRLDQVAIGNDDSETSY